MKPRLLLLWERTSSSFWFVPSLLTAAAILVSVATVAADAAGFLADAEPRWLWSIEPEGAYRLLTTVATSAVTVAGVVFSITVVVLTLASSQFGPRLVRSFMHDRGTQLALGSFLATFVYCLFVLYSVRVGQHVFAPRFSVYCALGLGVLDVGVLIYFIHHISVAIQASTVVGRVSRELLEGLDRLLPAQLTDGRDEGDGGSAAGRARNEEGDGEPLCAPWSGYLVSLDVERLLELAVKRDLWLVLDVRPGRFVVEGSAIGTIRPAGRTGDGDRARLLEAFAVGSYRSITQDCEFAIDQLVEVALRALSPGINDPHTAMVCIDYLGAALAQVATRAMPPTELRDGHGAARLRLPAPTFSGLLGAAFNEIRQHGGGNIAVAIRLLESLRRIAQRTPAGARLQAVALQARLVAERAAAAADNEHDRGDIEGRFQAVLDIAASAPGKEDAKR